MAPLESFSYLTVCFSSFSPFMFECVEIFCVLNSIYSLCEDENKCWKWICGVDKNVAEQKKQPEMLKFIFSYQIYSLAKRPNRTSKDVRKDSKRNAQTNAKILNEKRMNWIKQSSARKMNKKGFVLRSSKIMMNILNIWIM